MNKKRRRQNYAGATIGQIKSVMDNLGFDQERLARAMDFSSGMISYALNGKRGINRKFVEALNRVCISEGRADLAIGADKLSVPVLTSHTGGTAKHLLDQIIAAGDAAALDLVIGMLRSIQSNRKRFKSPKSRAG